MAGKLRRLSVYRALQQLTGYNQKVSNIHAHTVARRHMAPVSQRGKKAVQHTARNVTNVGVLDIFRGYANQRRNMKLKKYLRRILMLRPTK